MNPTELLGGIIQDVANIQDIHLSAHSLMGSIDGYDPSIPAATSVKIDPVDSPAWPGCF